MPDLYIPVSDIISQLNLALDMRDIVRLVAATENHQPVEWAAVKSIYENGCNSRNRNGSLRNLSDTAINPEVLERFPNGVAVMGDPSFLNAMVRDAIDGTGIGHWASDVVRGKILSKAILAIVYGEVLEELNTARAKLRERQTGDERGAPHNVDKAWASYVGAFDGLGNRPYAISHIAMEIEREFGLENKIDIPVQRAIGMALASSRKGYVGTFLSAMDQTRGYLNAVFYLGALGSLNKAVAEYDSVNREIHLADGWGFFQTIRPAVASISVEAGDITQAAYSSSPSKPISKQIIRGVYKALNDPVVLKGLLIPGDLLVQAHRILG